MLILTSDHKALCNWGPGQSIETDVEGRDHVLFVPYPGIHLFRGTEEQCRGVLWEIANADPNGLYVVPSPEQYMADEATFRRVTTEALEREALAHRKAHPEAYQEAEG